MPTVQLCCNCDHLHAACVPMCTFQSPDETPYTLVTMTPVSASCSLTMWQNVVLLKLKLGTSFDTAFLRSMHDLDEVACCPGT